MTVEPASPTPASSEGLDHLVELLGELLGSTSAGVHGPDRDDVAEALERVGIAVSAADQDSVELIVSVGVVSGASLEDARRHVGRLAQRATLAIVFSAIDDHLRFPPWWDELFAEHDFEPVDVLRTRLWDDEGWDAAALSGLTLYVRRSERSVVVAEHGAGTVPRSAVHPGLLVPARRDAAALRALASRVRPGAAPDADSAVIVEHALDAARDELLTELARAREVVLSARAEAQQRADQDQVELMSARRESEAIAAARQHEEEARQRAEDECHLLREERDAVVAAAAAPPEVSASAPSRLIRRTGAAIGRRVELRALAAADRLGSAPGVAGRISRRSASVYRSVNADWREATRELFDTDHYLAQRPGLVGSGLDPVVHYSRTGWREGLDPHPLFDTDWYLRTNRALIGADVSPLEHFVSTGWREGCDPHPLFDTDFYLRRSKDVAVSGENSLVHYVREGWHQGRDPHPLFETRRYLDLYPDVRDAGVCPLVDYVLFGCHEGRSPSELFDAEWYLDRYPEARASGLPPYRYFLEVGVCRGDLPSEWAERRYDGSGTSDRDRVVV